MAFHPYPQVIAAVFNRRAFGPPRGLTPASACPGIAHPASRPARATRRPVRTRLLCGSLPSLTSPRASDSLAHSTKGTPSHQMVLRLLVGARFQVLFHSPPGVLFTFPLAVLVRYRSQESVQAWMVVHPGSDRVSRARPYSGAASAPDPRVRLRGCNPVPPAVPCRSAPLDRCAPGAAAPGRRGPTTPAARTLPRACARRFGHGPLPLAATRGISQLISPPPGT